MCSRRRDWRPKGRAARWEKGCQADAKPPAQKRAAAAPKEMARTGSRSSCPNSFSRIGQVERLLHPPPVHMQECSVPAKAGRFTKAYRRCGAVLPMEGIAINGPFSVDEF